MLPSVVIPEAHRKDPAGGNTLMPWPAYGWVRGMWQEPGLDPGPAPKLSVAMWWMLEVVAYQVWLVNTL